MPATRSTRATAAAKAGRGRPPKASASGNAENESSSNSPERPSAPAGPPPKVILLPSDQDQSPYTILSLPHPRTKVPTRYLLHPTRHALLFEITKVKEPPSKKRSWLIHNPKLAAAEESEEGQDDKEEKEEKGQEAPPGIIVKEAILHVTTPIDVLYLLLLHLMEGRASRNFLTLEDIFESHPQASTWARIMKSSPDAERMVHDRVRAACDTVSAGDEDMYRLSTTKVLDLLYGRVCKMAEALPGSLKALVVSQLAKPLKGQVSVIARPKAVIGAADEDGVIDDKELEEEVKAETGEGQSGTNTPSESQKSLGISLRTEDSTLSATSELAKETEELTLGPPGETITAEAVLEQEPPPPNVEKLARLNQALSFLIIYIPPSLRTALTDHVDKLHPPSELDEYLAELKKLRAEAAAAIESSMMHTKRTLEDIEGGVRDKQEAEQEKKRRKKEEDARKSAGVKKLEKVNTKGMAKMTSFFKKKE